MHRVSNFYGVWVLLGHLVGYLFRTDPFSSNIFYIYIVKPIPQFKKWVATTKHTPGISFSSHYFSGQTGEPYSMLGSRNRMQTPVSAAGPW